MASNSSDTSSPPNSPPASLLVETIDPRTTTVQSLEEQSHDTSGPASPESSDSSDRTITPRDLPFSLSASPSASSDRTITRGDLTGPAHQSSQPPQNPPTFPAITDRIAFPLAARPAVNNLERRYQYGVLDFPHVHLQIGRDLRANPNTMEPAPPARVVQRNDCDPVNWPIPNGDPKDKVLASKGRTSCLGPRVVTYAASNEATESTTTTTSSTTAAAAPAPAAAAVTTTTTVPGVSGTEGLAGLGDELAALVLAKSEYNDRFGAFRGRWTKAQSELAARAEEVRGTRFTTAAELHPFVDTVGVMFALGRAVDLAAFPGTKVGEFDEKACSPEGYLSSLFPTLTSPSAGAAGVVFPIQWDFSLGAIMAGEERDLLRGLWAAAVAGDWEAVDEMTSGTLAKAEELLGGGGI